jgi:hypothetical protein
MATRVTARKLNPNKLNLFLDLTIALAFVVELQERFTGLRNHELLGVALGFVLVVHILLHWQWIVSITRHFFRNLLHGSRLNYVLNLALFADMAILIVTGLLVSRTLGLNLGLDRQAQGHWQRVHILSSEAALIIVALHVAVHWKWIIAHARKYLFNVRLSLPWRKPQATAAVLPIIQAK